MFVVFSLSRWAGPLWAGVLCLCLSHQVGAGEFSQYIDLALENDQRIALAKTRFEASRFGVDAANAPRRPQLSTSGSYSWTDQQEHIKHGYNNAEFSLEVQQSLWERSQIARRDAARLKTHQAELGIEQATEQLLAELSEAFFALLGQRSVLRAWDAQILALATSLQREEARLSAGISSPPQVTSVRAQYNQALARRISARAGLDAATDLLQRLLGVSASVPQTNAIPVFAMPDGTIESWVKTAEGDNINLRLARNAIAQTDQAIRLARRSNGPSLNLFGRYARSSNLNGQDLINEYQRVGVRLSVPLYTGGSSSAATREAEQNYLAAQLDFDYKASLLASNVRLKWRQLAAQLAIINANQISLLAATQSLDLSQNAYDNNTLILQDLLDAQARFYNARRDLAAAQYGFSRQLIGFYQTAGELDRDRLARVADTWVL